MMQAVQLRPCRAVQAMREVCFTTRHTLLVVQSAMPRSMQAVEL